MGTYHGLEKNLISTEKIRDDDFFKKYNYMRRPLLVQWMSTYSCPLDCPHCLCGDGHDVEELTLDEIASMLDQVAALGVKEFLVTGGEPAGRPDMPEVVEMLRRRGMRWSINTSVFPNAGLRRAMEKHPPAFAAVSLDGGPEFHDRFRGKAGAWKDCMDAISYYSDLTEGNTAAGTTVHAGNFDELGELFFTVAGSGAGSWGLHLLFPEGRARGRPELELSKKQLKKLLSFVAARRRYFPVILADEIGYCGDMEPVLRDEPFFCGAGRAQCVILPDGKVVPCTTTDPSELAGSIRKTALEEIWKNGFGHIREYEPRGKCQSCYYQPACGGGCYLQRRHGRQCFREVWKTPRTLAAAAGIALCLGLSIPHSSAAEPGKKPADKKAPANESVFGGRHSFEPRTLEHFIVDYYLIEFDSRFAMKKDAFRKLLEKKIGGDPAVKYLNSLLDGKYPKDPGARTERIIEAAKSRRNSLAYAALLWRDLMLWCFDSDAPEKRSSERRELLKKTIGQLERKSHAVSLEIFEKKLDPFLSTDPARRGGWFMRSKAMMPREDIRIARARLSMEHWGMKKNTDKITLDYVKKFPFGRDMALTLECEKDDEIYKRNSDGSSRLKEKDRLGIFDVLATPWKKNAAVVLVAGKRRFKVLLPGGSEFLYGDLLNVAFKQNAKEMVKLVKSGKAERSPAYLPALGKIIKSKDTDISDRDRSHFKKTACEIWMF